ncbi:MAG TPA: polysaccharide biosynthesis/export family protein [Vicinamibacterales bacterium]|nr:polysaccharide biosynthesis/export family protein [Vicinamibacterales bacterium]
MRHQLLSAAIVGATALGAAASTSVIVHTQAPAPALAANAAAPAPIAAAAAAVPTRSATPAGYLIGVDDVLSIVFWRDKDLSAPDITVRPDGKVTLPLLNDVQAAGLTPEQLRDSVLAAARKYVEDPQPTVIVKEIKSRKVFITGQVEKPGPYPLNGSVTVLQLIATAGGLRDFADGKNITVMRMRQGKQAVFEFNYQDLVKRKNLFQNIELEPGDTVVVP